LFETLCSRSVHVLHVAHLESLNKEETYSNIGKLKSGKPEVLKLAWAT
jgi:hypothetical protein